MACARKRPHYGLLSTYPAEDRQRVGAASGFPAVLRELGVQPEALFEKAGLMPGAFDDPANVVSFVSLGELLCQAARATRLPHVGLLMGRLWHLGDFGLSSALLRNAPTIGEALRMFVVHQHLNCGGGVIFLLERGGMVDFGYSVYHPAVRCTREIHDSAIAAAFNVLRELCGPGWFPSDVFIPHARPADAVHYRNFFKLHPRFDSEYCAIRFPAKWLSRPVEGADPVKYAAAIRAVEAAGEPVLLQQVYRALRILMLHGKNSGDDVAQAMNMHRRTLNRRLKAHGTTFQEVLDEARLELSRQLLAESNVSLDDIAATLGYNGVSPFMRAFRRWTGDTPGHWRRALAGEQCRVFAEASASVGPRPLQPVATVRCAA